jgi:hypothetical protein
MFHPPELERSRQRDRFDPIREGERYGLSRDQSLAIFERVSKGATDSLGRSNEEQAWERFRELAAHIAARGERLQPDPGRLTRVGEWPGAWAADELVPRAPGKQTLVATETGRWVNEEMAIVDDASTRKLPAEQVVTPSTPGLQEPGWKAPSPGLGAYRMSALKEVIERIGPNHRLRHELITATANPVRSIAGTALWGGPLPGVSMTNGHALWQVAERHATTLYRRAVNGGAADQHDPAVESALQQRGAGQPLPAELRREMERELGVSLAGVRVHTDAVAARAARALSAEAFAIGEDIFFAEGMFVPDTRSGKKLLVHELTHVAQALRGDTRPTGDGLRLSQPGEPLEREADDVAARVDDVAARPTPAAPARRHVEKPVASASSPAGPAAIYRQAAPVPPRAQGDLRDPRQFPTYEEFLAAFQELPHFPGMRTGHDVLGDREANDASADQNDHSVTRRNDRPGESYIEHPTAQWVNNHLPSELRMAVYKLPADCADVAVLLRHVWLFARGRTERYGRWTIGAGAGRTEAGRVRSLTQLIGFDVSSGSVQRMISTPYASRSFTALEPLLHPGDVLVWEHHDPQTHRRSGGHTHTIQNIERDEAGQITSITCLQGNQPIDQPQANQIRQDQQAQHQSPTSEATLRALPGRRIERNRLEGMALQDDTDGIWTWNDDDATTLVAAGPPSGVQRPAMRRIAGDRRRRISDWGPSLRTATDATIEGVFEAFLSEVRSSLEGGSPNAAEIRREAPDVAEIAGERLARLRITAARRQELGTMLVAQARSMSTHLNPGAVADDRAAFTAIGDRLRDAAGITEAAAPASAPANGPASAPANGPASAPADLPVQRKAAPAPAGEDAGEVQAVAAEAVSGSGGSLPYLDEIQLGFGHHDVSGVTAHTGAGAAAAARAIGAEAFATGNDVAFAGAPTLFTAAHEAAHVVQQQGGVQLKDGVGEEGDVHEQHADRVAARIVAGQSAVDLLDEVAPRGRATQVGAGAPVQRRVEDRPATHPVLREGMNNSDDVRQLQTRLNQDGAQPPLGIDGWFGPLTRAALIAFQGRHALEPDGVCGLRTWGILDELSTQGIAGPTRTVLDRTRPVSQADRDAVEQILNPNVTVSGGATTSPSMTGTGASGAYEQGMISRLDALAAQFTGNLATTPVANMSQANSMADLAQERVQRVFGGSMVMASRRPSGDFHPGSSRMGLADASTRPVDEGTILGWCEYFMDNGSYSPGQFQASQHYDNSRATPDRAEHDRVRDLWLHHHGGRAKTTALIRSWPAEAGTGTVFVQLRDPSYQDRVGLWGLFGTFLHEFMHLAAHPNYAAAADAIGGAARDVLIEGMDEHMTQQAWNAIRPTIAADRPLRAAVEGSLLQDPVVPTDYAAGSPIDHRILDNHYDSMTQADAIAARVGEDNVRAAYFMGHVEAIGLGPSTRGEHSLAGIASWGPSANGEPDRYPVPPAGETVQEICNRTGVQMITDAAGTRFSDPTHRFASGTTLTVTGIRWHTAIAEDTRGQVANQHGISQAALERANRLSAAAPTTPITAGTLLLIPVA